MNKMNLIKAKENAIKMFETMLKSKKLNTKQRMKIENNIKKLKEYIKQQEVIDNGATSN